MPQRLVQERTLYRSARVKNRGHVAIALFNSSQNISFVTNAGSHGAKDEMLFSVLKTPSVNAKPCRPRDEGAISTPRPTS